MQQKENRKRPPRWLDWGGEARSGRSRVSAGWKDRRTEPSSLQSPERGSGLSLEPTTPLPEKGVQQATELAGLRGPAARGLGRALGPCWRWLQAFRAPLPALLPASKTRAADEPRTALPVSISVPTVTGPGPDYRPSPQAPVDTSVSQQGTPPPPGRGHGELRGTKAVAVARQQAEHRDRQAPGGQEHPCPCTSSSVPVWSCSHPAPWDQSPRGTPTATPPGQAASATHSQLEPR